MLKKPVIIVNFKAYPQATGARAVELARICEHVALETNVSIAIAVQALDLQIVAASVRIPVLAQHADGVSLGAHTGAIAPEALKLAGAAGTLINHAEWRIPLKNIDAAIRHCRAHGLDVVACAETPEKARQIAMLRPTFVAIEPPELIGGSVSVSEARPEIITETTNGVRNVPVICGAGVHNQDDVAKAIALGTVGVLVASGVVLAKDPEAVLKDLIAGLP
jgi:triosephosphate isomerase